MLGKLVIAIMLVSLVPFAAHHAQGLSPSEPTRATRLERFEAASRGVVVRGSAKIGSIETDLGAATIVQVREVIEMESHKRQLGVAIEIDTGRQGKGTAYVDLEDVDALIKSIEYLKGVSPSVTTLESFQADLVTDTGLRLSTFKSDKTIGVAIRIDAVGGAVMFTDLAGLQRFSQLLVAAKARLDAIK